MNQQIILLTDANTASALELIESLSSTGLSVFSQDLDEVSLGSAQPRRHPLALLYEVGPELGVEGLSAVIERTSRIWPGVSILACRHQAAKPGARNPAAPDNATLKRLGFRAVADNPAQLPALLRQVEDAPGAGELKLPPGFKSTPNSQALSLPAAVRGNHLRGAFSLLASLHLASNQKKAGQVALAGVARLVPTDRWAIFLLAQTSSPDAIAFQPLIARNFSPGGSLSFDEEWQRELLDDADLPNEPESKAAHEAVTRIEAVTQVEKGRRVIALPLVSGETVLGVLEGVRDRRAAGAFSRSESALLAALAIPVASALANSVRIAEAELLSVTDDLTKLHNARYLRQFLVNEIKRARRYNSSIAALFLDLDDFKRVNDMHGHLVGSHALMEVASVILPSVRDTDCVIRYGGDEFVVILPETKIDEAIWVADRIRAKIERHQFTGGRRLKLFFTASFGIAIFPQNALSPQQLIACADTAMYEAKAAGKNCIRVAGGAVAAAAADVQDSSLAGPTQFQRIPDEKLIS